MHEGVQGERGVAQPAIAIIPIAGTTQLLRQRGGYRGDDATRRPVGESFQCYQRTLHHVAVRPLIAALSGPLLPESLRLFDGLAYIDRARRMQMRTAIGHHEIDALPFVHCEFTDRGKVFAGKRGFGAKDHQVRPGNSADSAVISA